MAVGRSVKMGTVYKMVYSDHFTCLLTLSNMPKVKEARQQKQTVWNLRKEGGWNMYKILSDECSEALEKVLDNEDTINNKMKKFNKIHERIKYKAFGKVTIGNKDRKVKERGDNVANLDAKELFEEEAKRAEEEIKEIKSMKK